MAENRYCVDYARLGTAGCKKCKVKIEKGSIRIAKVVANPFSDEGGDMKQWYHVKCIFETFQRARASTKKIEEPEDLDGWEHVQKEDRDFIISCIKESQDKANAKKPTKSKATKKAKLDITPTNQVKLDITPKKRSTSPDENRVKPENCIPDNSFRKFRRLCANIAEESSYNAKTNIISKFLTDGTSGNGFQGDLHLWIKLLLPGVAKRIYNIQSKQLVKLFSQIFGTSQEEMIEDLEQGDAAETIKTFFEKSTKCPPAKKSHLTIHDVDEYLNELSQKTKEDDQMRILTKITKKCTANDLKIVIRLIKHDLRINAGAKHILEAVHPDAYQAFQASRNLKDVIDEVERCKKNERLMGSPSKLKIQASLMTPVLPMLAEACKSVEYAMKKCPNGMYAEIKYDGERVQLHKEGTNFKYFSRSLKPVLPHKVEHFKDYIPKAFPLGNDLILDCEVLLIDTNTSLPLPFGTLGKHKKAAFKDANVCLFVFDCIYYNDENLMHKPLKERKKILHSVMTEIPNHVMFSEMKKIKKQDDLQQMIMEVLRKGLEGLVLKDVMSVYEPGKRHWLKVKKDYLNQGALADTADLVVLGAFYGTGNKGGMMSIFLMGCYDTQRKKWVTVTKVHGGHDDKTLEKLQTELEMIKVGKDQSKVPKWLEVTKNMVPDFVCKDPKKSQVWEITGAEFTKAEIHTANGISIRFPRVTRIRSDKNWETATNLKELEHLFKMSRDSSDLPDLSSSPEKSPKSKNVNEDDIDYGSETEVDEEDEPLPKKKTPTKEKKTPTKEKKIPTKEKKIPTKEKKTPTKEKKTPTKEKKTPTKEKKTLAKENKTPAKENKTPAKENKTPAKRKKNDSCESEMSPAKKARQTKLKFEQKSDSKLICTFGAQCYRTNEQHLEEFEHPRDPKKHPTKNPLPDIFTNITIYLPKNEDQYQLLHRYIIAYDGDVADDVTLSRATHVVASSKVKKSKLKEKSSDAHVISVNWIWDCIKSKQLKPTDQYLVDGY